MYVNSIENELYAASTTCLPGAGEAGGESAIVVVMLGLEHVFDATRGIAKVKAVRLAMRAISAKGCSDCLVSLDVA